MKIGHGPNIQNEKLFFQKEGKSLEAPAFQKIFSEHQTKIAKEHLHLLLEDIQKQGETLTRSRTTRDLKKYKTMIKTFLQEVVKMGFSLEETSSFSLHNRERKLKVIREIDMQLLQLSSEILEKEDGNLRLLEKIGELRGMLIDLLV